MPAELNNCPTCGASLPATARTCPHCQSVIDPPGREPEDRISQGLLRHDEDDHPDVQELLHSSAATDDAGSAEEPEVIVIREPVLITGDRQHNGSAGSSQRARAASCYVSRSCPTCAPCCLAAFLAPMLFLIWTIYPSWKESREMGTSQPQVRLFDSRSTPDPASDRLKSEVEQMQFADRAAILTFMAQRGIEYEVQDGYWLARDRTQQEAVVILQQRWQALPQQPPAEE